MLRRVALFSLGLTFVLGARLATRDTAPAPEAAPEVPTRAATPAQAAPAPTPAAPDTDAAACADLQTELLDRLDAIQAAADEIEDLEALLSGEPLPWPDDVPERFREASVRATFEDAAAAVGDGLVLRDLRCDEYPCIGIFERLNDTSQPGGYSNAVEVALTKALDALDREDEAVALPLGTWRAAAFDGNHHVAIALHAPDLGDAERSRLHHRWHDYETDERGWRTVRHFAQ